ncbi:MAG: hypothetical protein IJ620_02630 [Bacteroidales bacterium]|nr:hypothetical protein [Bacteroidales bacterium]
MATLLPILASCKDDEETPTRTQAEVVEITAVFVPGGLGDRGFSDNVYEGIYRIKEYYKGDQIVAIRPLIPQDEQEAYKYIEQWFADDSSEYRRLLVTVGDAYGAWFEKNPHWRPKGQDDVLFLDSRVSIENCYSRYITLYGLSYMAGLFVKNLGSETPFVLKANNIDFPINEAANAFWLGYRGTTEHFMNFTLTLADSANQGYNLPDSAFQLCTLLNYLGFDFVYPLCGYSNQGLFRFMRSEMAERLDDRRIYTCGMDADQYCYSTQILFSIVKRYDLVLEQFVTDWLQHKKMDKKVTFGLGTEHAVYIVSPLYQDMVDYRFIDSIQQVSIAFEQRYLDSAYAH